jgi:rhodanese-related sulfurtransferase
MTIQVDKRVLVVLLGIGLLGVPLVLGLWVGVDAVRSLDRAPAAAQQAPAPPAAVPGGAAAPPNAVAGASPQAAATAQVNAEATLATLPQITVEDAHKQFGDPNTVFVDTRVKAAFDQNHLKGAISVPEAEITARAAELPKDKDLILYCTCPHAEEAARSTQVLMGLGFTRVKVLDGGMQKWYQLYPTEIEQVATPAAPASAP